LPEKTGVLVVDQTRGDISLEYDGMSTDRFNPTVRDELDEYSGEPIYLRSHPDHHYRDEHSCFSPWVLKNLELPYYLLIYHPRNTSNLQRSLCWNIADGNRRAVYSLTGGRFLKE
jgi:hypothetical protein